MTRTSKEHVLSLEGGPVVDHSVPMVVLLHVLQNWYSALQEALPSLVSHLSLSSEEAREALSSVEPLASAVKPGSVAQPWAYGIAGQSTDAVATMFVTDELLDNLADTFEKGVSDLQREHVAAWMTGRVAKPLLNAVKYASKRGMQVKLAGSKAVLSDAALNTLSKFVSQEERGQKAEIQVFGTINSVNVRDSYVLIATNVHGNVRASFSRSHRVEVCRALSEETPVEAVVSAILTSDRTLENANLRSIQAVGRPASYRDVLRSVWGSGREMFADLPHDERGVPDLDPEMS